uniref:Transmembrane protein 26a n=1 Tax=Oryzias sinensis TaxID=183150 RepID=A0A8C7XXQ5_9TELE
ITIGICKFICAVITRALFILVSLVGVFRVTSVKNDRNYWQKITNGKTRFSVLVFMMVIFSVIIPSIWIFELHHQENKSTFCTKALIFEEKQNLKAVLASVCSNDSILWLIALSQLLLVFIGTAADILEFTNESLSVVKWFYPPSTNSGQDGLWRNSTDIWNIMETFFIQDGPFLLVRLTVTILIETIHQTLVFFAIKNSFVIILNLYRLCVICNDYKSSHHSPVSSDDAL